MLQPNLNLVGACQAIQQEASNMAIASRGNYAYMMGRKTGALDFILSAENSGGIEVVPGSGRSLSHQNGSKLASLEVFYDQRTKPCQISEDCDANVCDDGAAPLRKQFTVNVTNCISTPVRQWLAQDLEALCIDPQRFMRERLMSDLRAAREKLSERLLAYLDTEIGINYEFDGTTTAAGQYKDLQLISTSSGQPIPLPGNFITIQQDFMNNQLMGLPAVIGWGLMDSYYRLDKMSCCNATTPFGAVDGTMSMAFYMDQVANTVLGDNKVVVTAYGAHHFVYFNENRLLEQMPNTQANDAIHIVIPDPDGYPIDWNFDLYFDHCDKKWKSMYSLMWEAFNVFQEDSFAGSGEESSPDVSPDCDDELDGMLATFGYNIKNS